MSFPVINIQGDYWTPLVLKKSSSQVDVFAVTVVTNTPCIHVVLRKSNLHVLHDEQLIKPKISFSFFELKEGDSGALVIRKKKEGERKGPLSRILVVPL